MDNNNQHAKERALQEQFCLKKIPRVVVPFFSHTLMGRYEPEGSRARGGGWGKVGCSRQLLIIVKKEEICLGVRLLFSLSQKYLEYSIWLKQIFGEAKKVRSQWGNPSGSAAQCVLPRPCLETRRHKYECRVPRYSRKHAWCQMGRALNYIINVV